jgi:hypothetical protein
VEEFLFVEMQQSLKERQGIALSIISYSLCSSTLLLANKAAMMFLPRPSIVSLIQILASLVIMQAFRLSGVEIDRLEWSKVKQYIIYVLAFTVSRYANMKALEKSNVETVIVFRACAPLAVSIIEFLFLGRSLPSHRAAVSLILVCVSAVVYCIADSEFSLHGPSAYTWVSIYFLLLIFEMTYCKSLTISAKMLTRWGPVYYCNTLAVIPTIAFGYAAGEFRNAFGLLRGLPVNGWLILIFSCVAGTFIG